MFLRPVNMSADAMQPKENQLREKLVSKREFDRSINIKAKVKKNESSFFITRSKYNLLLGQVKAAKKKKADELNPKLAKLVKKYDVAAQGGVERLVVPNSANQLIYIAKDELFTAISRAHIDTDHGKLPEMKEKLKNLYKNISGEAITSYIKLCPGCKTRARRKTGLQKEDESKENVETRSQKADVDKPKGSAPSPNSSEKPRRKYKKRGTTEVAAKKTKTKPPPTKRFRNTPENASTRPQTARTRTPQRIDFIEMSECKDYEYYYIVVLRESTTKFVHLRPLKSRSPEELSDILYQVFVCFGTPSVLSSTNCDFIKSSLEALYSKHPAIPNDVEVEPSEESCFLADIETLTLSWVISNTGERWYKGLRFVQYIANLTFNKDIGKTPFEAMFGRKGKLDLSTLNLPEELLSGIRPEEECDDEIRDVEINEMLEIVLNDE